MEKEKNQNLANDIENRLDNFFGNIDSPAPTQQPAATLQKLKSVVLSIDWEITDACLTELISESEKLLPAYQEDRLTHALLRMLRALGGYIRKRKAQAHPDAIRNVMSVFNSLERLISDPTLSESVKAKILAKEIAAFKKLKQQIKAKKQDEVPPAPDSEPAATSYVAQGQFQQAINAVEQRVNAQVATLKAELSALQKELDRLRKG